MSIRDRSNSKIIDSNRTLERFTDRHELTRRFSEYINNPTPETILYFYGAGGNGKSLLLRFLQVFCCKWFPARAFWQQLQNSENFSQVIKTYDNAQNYIVVPSVSHDFALPARGDEQPQDPFYGLLMLRRNLARATKDLEYRLRFPLFDFACLWYLHKKDQLRDDRIKELFPSDALDLINETVDLIKEIPGVGLAKTLLGILNKKTGEWFTLYRAKYGLNEANIQEIQRLDPDRELIYELPRYFAHDLNTQIGQPERPSKLVLFFDTHEKFWDGKRQTQGDSFFYQDEWFRYLLRELELKDGIVVVVAGRELPKWHEATRYDIPQDCIDAYDVRDFYISDAIEYLQLAQIEEELQQAIINYSTVTDNQIHPFLLALCVDVVENAKKRNVSITTEIFKSQVVTEKKPQELIDRLLKYVDRHIAYAVAALSACRFFDFELYRYLGEKLYFDATRPDFEILTSFSFVKRDDTYRLHALLCRLNDEANNPITRQAHEILEAYYREQGNHSEAIYHANRLDWQRGVDEWYEVFEEALKTSRYGDCRTLLGVRNELNIYSYFQFAWISALEGDYSAELSRHQEAGRKYVEAIWGYLSDLEATPENTFTLSNLGTVIIKLGDLQANLSQSQEALESYREAIEAYTYALSLAPDDIYAHNNKGIALAKLGDLQATLSQSQEALESYQQTITVFNHALNLAPNDIYAHNNKGLALKSLGNLQASLSRSQEALESYQQAIAAFNHALNLAPDFIYAHNNKGLALQELGDLQANLSQSQEALESYRQAIKAYTYALNLAPDTIYAHINKGLALQELGDLQANLSQSQEALESYRQAIEAFNHALNLAPDDIPAHNNKGLALQSLGELQADLSQSQEALESYQQAIEAYSYALPLAPDYILAHNNKGFALIKLGDLLADSSQTDAISCWQQALAHFSRSLELAPRDDSIRQRRDSLVEFLQGLE